MIFSHISDMHLGLVQYGSEEREQDVYSAFNQAIDTSIKDHVSFVIFAGDIFHVPNPSGTAILQMANALKRLKQNNIDSFFILGEHDISRIRSTPIPYIYHNLEFSHYIGQGNAIKYKDILLAGFDKMRKSEIPKFENNFSDLDKIVKNHHGHKILVMHQGITEFNKFAGELSSTDLPKNFTYYAMGHLHDHSIKKFNHLNGSMAYPGSLELTTSEGINETKKGFYEVDISTAEASSSWIEVDTRPQFSFKMEYDNLVKSVDDISQKILKLDRKPILELKISGEKIETDYVQAQISRLNPHSLRCFWKIINNQRIDSTIYFEKPDMIDEELYRLSVTALGSEQIAHFAVKELLPLLSTKQLDDATQIVIENFQKYKKRKQK